MAYQKTAKDLAWDRERTKLKSEISDWVHRCGDKEKKIQEQQREILILANRVRDLEEAIGKLTDGKMSADEAVESLRSSAKIGEMAAFLMRHSSLGGYL